MSQPKWKFVGNIGDASPLDYGGFFVYVDETGVYPPEAEVVELDDESDDPHYTVYRFVLDKCTYIDGVLSDNKYHPEHPAWWASPENRKQERPQDTTYLSNICSCCDIETDELIRMFCSDDPLELASAYRYVAECHGYHELDHEPRQCRRRELWKRYMGMNGEDYGKRS